VLGEWGDVFGFEVCGVYYFVGLCDVNFGYFEFVCDCFFVGLIVVGDECEYVGVVVDEY